MLKTVYFDAHHRHKWQCFRIRLVDKAFPTYPLFNRQEIELADAYDKAIKNLRDQGQLDELEIKYLGEKIGDYLNRK